MQNDKYYNEIEEKFTSKNNTELLKTLKEIKTRGNAKILPLLFDFLSSNPDKVLEEEIFSILGQLKDKESIPYIIEEIENKRAEKYIARIITTCWQSGLDYSKYLSVFVDKFIFGDYVTSIEAFTVIEEWIHISTQEDIIDCKKILIDRINDIKTEKKPLYIELVKIFETHL